MTTTIQGPAFTRWCRRCGWKGTYDTASRADYAKRKHSCEKWAQKLAGQQRRAARLAAVDRTPKPCLHKIADHQHGTRAAYVLDQCRCFPCSAANAEAETQRERQKAYGRYDKYVDAEPVRDHVRALMAQGMGWKRVAAAAGVSSSSMWKLLYGKRRPDGSQTPSRRCTRVNAERLLAVELDLADGAKLLGEDSIGTPRRLQALVALGWSMSKLAERLGILPTNIGPVIHGRRGVTVATAKAVRDLYDELSMTLPPEDTHRDRIAASRARRYAKARGWRPPLALDDELLDRPYDGDLMTDDTGDDLDEQAIWRRLHGDKSVRLTKAEKAELVRQAREQGWSYLDIERRAGIAKAERYLDVPAQEAS